MRNVHTCEKVNHIPLSRKREISDSTAVLSGSSPDKNRPSFSSSMCVDLLFSVRADVFVVQDVLLHFRGFLRREDKHGCNRL